MVGFLHTLLYLSLPGLTSSSMFDGLESKSSALSLKFLCGRSPSSSFGASKCLSESDSSSSTLSAAVLCASPHLSIFLAQSNVVRLIPVVTIRLFYLSPSENPDPTVTSIIVNILTKAALELCLITACIISLKLSSSPSTQATLSTVLVQQGPVCALESVQNPRFLLHAQHS